MSFTVLIADDHFPVRFGLELLTKETLGTNTKIDFAIDFNAVLEKINEQSYDLLISDIMMPGMDCMSMMTEALRLRPGLKILFVSVNPKEIFALRYMNAGAYGYVCKTDSDEELKKAIRNIYLGKRYYPEGIMDGKTMLVKGKKVNSLFDLLSQREFAVMMQLLEGKGIIEIANTLSLNPSTASTYRGRIFEKLKVRSLIELSNLAREHNFSLD
ncbi:DNA-binding response regulator, NarL/FixJ family, contains REC and HTH domains [Arachidicoccus rhizosphaerae]|jgi:two-component system invasion response regulator UvrY|uniref:DNA-binding response regulator, NarL/FixJ family, contains REC and HTH domains n=1 Tax=Arachidicoccus rhizosphaerae TaxID=551991 RepID=A0A1H4C021_9BACT|nr:response regulator transcription factor [Arachidicoccus rhizosphaerae]SEA53795.1 DNA-binding response regulator, NarL/FixJ family, contains REC and HTH domains [Arachidicoccus rhizosphaerae]